MSTFLRFAFEVDVIVIFVFIAFFFFLMFIDTLADVIYFLQKVVKNVIKKIKG